MAQDSQPQVQFEGEEAGTGYASPVLDMIASGVLFAFSLVVMVASFALPMPGEIRTAPGLLPFLVAFSLMLMAVALGASAVTRHWAGVRIPVFADRDLSTDLRSLLLAVLVAAYIAALQFLAFQTNFTFLGLHLKLSAFEPVTTIALATLIHISWRGPIWITTSVSLFWALTLSGVFQLVFRQPLPGTF